MRGSFSGHPPDSLIDSLDPGWMSVVGETVNRRNVDTEIGTDA